jgi:hypothetical protein
METIVTSCPECQKQVKAPASAAGKKIRCKACQHVFVLKAPAAAKASKGAPAKPGAPGPGDKAAKPAAKASDDDEAGHYGVTSEDDSARCPQCAGAMEEGAVICLNCGFNTRTREQARTKKVKDVSGGDKFLWLLPGFLAVLGAILLLGYCFFHHFALPGILVDDWAGLVEKHGGRLTVLSKEENIPMWKGALIHPGVSVWLFVPAAFGCFKLGRFAVRRLIFENTPPEIEKK